MNLENKKQIATLLAAIGLGLTAVVLTGQYVQNNVNEQTKALSDEYQKKNVAVVNELEAVKGELKRVNVQFSQLAAQQEQLRQLKVASAQQPTEKPAETRVPFSLKTPPGKRAYTINIDSLSAVGGLINPGDFVDIIGQLKVTNEQDPKQPPQDVTSVIFQNVQVLAIGINFNPSGDPAVYDVQQKARSLYVTLALDPEEASLLTFAQTNGKLQLSLRSPKERDTQTLHVASWDALSDFVLERQGTELILPKGKASIETVDGAKTEEVKPFIQVFKSGKESNF